MKECKDNLTYAQEESLALAIISEQETDREYQLREEYAVPASLLDVVF